MELNKILDESIKEYDTYNTLQDLLQIMVTRTQDSMNNFTKTLGQMVIDLDDFNKKGYIDYKTGYNLTVILLYIKNRSKFVIDTYINHLYNENNGILRKYILEGNDLFFLTDNSIKFDDSTMMDKLFEFRNYWPTIPAPIQNIIKTYLIMLTEYADIKYINQNRYTLLKDYNTKYNNLFKKYDNIF